MLSIVIPAHNEERRIERTLAEVANRCLEAFETSKLLAESPNRGKGHAVRTGMLAARGSLRLFMDADGSTDMKEIARFVGPVAEPHGSHDAAIASIGVDGAWHPSLGIGGSWAHPRAPTLPWVDLW